MSSKAFYLSADNVSYRKTNLDFANNNPFFFLLSSLEQSQSQFEASLFKVPNHVTKFLFIFGLVTNSLALNYFQQPSLSVVITSLLNVVATSSQIIGNIHFFSHATKVTDRQTDILVIVRIKCLSVCFARFGRWWAWASCSLFSSCLFFHITRGPVLSPSLSLSGPFFVPISSLLFSIYLWKISSVHLPERMAIPLFCPRLALFPIGPEIWKQPRGHDNGHDAFAALSHGESTFMRSLPLL